MPTEATVQDQIARLADILIFLMDEGGSAATNLLDLVNGLVPEGDYNVDLVGGLRDVVAGMENAITAGPRSFDAMLKSYGQVMQVPELGGAALCQRLYRWCIDNGITVKSREFTFGAPSGPSSNQGSGVIRRLTKDAYGYDIESGFPELKKLQCIRDRYSGADALGGEEVFKIWGDARSPYRLQVRGSGLSAEVRGRTCRDTQGLVQNPSFSAVVGDVPAVDSFTGWELVSGTLPQCDQADGHQFRTYQGEGTPSSLKVTGNFLFRQDLTQRAAKFNPDRPYFSRMAWNTEIGSAVAATGAMIIVRVGNVEYSTPFDGTEVGWQLLVGPDDEEAWFRNFNASPLYVEIEVQGLGSGYLNLDDFQLYQWDRFDQTYLTVDGGEDPFMFDDEYSFEDTAVDDCEIQRLFAYTKSTYMPHGTGATGSPITWADHS
jgi:hypothetical protein